MLKIQQKLPRLCNFPLIRSLSNQPVQKEWVQNDDQQLKEFERISNIQLKIRKKLPQKPPFLKNLLLGVFDNDILAYPEMTNEDLKNLNRNIEEASSYLRQPQIFETNTFSPDFLRKLAKGRLLGLQSSQLMNGRELNATETCRFFELIAEHDLKNHIINNEILGIQILTKFGSDYLKRKYLQRLIDGDSFSAFCLVEPLPTKMNMFKLSATKTSDGKRWILNGFKNSILNGSEADLFIVLANTSYVIKDEVREKKFTAFVVERDFGGITSTRKPTIDGKCQLSDLVFENTEIPNENIIGEENCGSEMLSAIFPEYRLSCGPICSVLIRKLINETTQHFINISSGPNYIYETDAIRLKLGEYLTSLYAIDSMTYLTSQLIDRYENQDTELESTIVKVFASEQALNTTKSALDLIGPEASVESHWCSQLHKEAICQVTLNDNNDSLKVLIALFGLKYAGKKINDTIKKIRNPLFHPTEAIRHMWKRRKQVENDPKLDLYLHYYLHPSCLQAAQRLEYCILRLQYATEVLFSRHGSEVINKHGDLRLLAEAMIDIYAMVAVLARASRSYCIGLQHCDHEMILASAFTINATKRAKAKLEALIEGPLQSTDENMRFLTEKLFNTKNYYPKNRDFAKMMRYTEENQTLVDKSPCAGVRADLKVCLLESDCCKIQRKTPKECLKSNDVPLECQALRNTFFECKRSMLDNRQRFRGRKGY